jgi:D-sedoheptulose 7-phosphate isomerase
VLDHYIRSYVEDLKATLDEFDRGALARAVTLVREAREQDRQIFIIGNGGSAAAASHMATDLGKGTIDWTQPDFRRFRAISLTDNTGLITALGNDVGYESIFLEQLKMLLNPGDLVFFISASGNSPNLLTAFDYAKARGAVTIGLLGFGGGKLHTLVDLPITVSSRNYGIAEDFHVSMQHILTQFLQKALSGTARPVVFLDRDGVVNESPGLHQYVTRWEDFRFTTGIVDAMRGLIDFGCSLVVITNQQGVGKGQMTATQLADLHGAMTRALETKGVTLAGLFHCPHLETDGCACRKPKAGMIYRAFNELRFPIDGGRSWLVGDAPTDIAAGQTAGLRTIYLNASGAAPTDPAPTHVARTPAEIVSLIAAASGPSQA